MTDPVQDQNLPSMTESLAVAVYAMAYQAYLFANPENELMHWLTMVLLPLTMLLIIRPKQEKPVRSLFASIGLGRQKWTRWLGWAALIGLSLSVLQLFVSRSADTILETITSGRAAYMFPLAFLLMLFMAGSTEEIFFRGILMTRLETLVRSKVGAVLVSSILFGFYHLPYAYLNPRWPSAGDWEAAFGAALGQGIPGGLILGWVYYASGRNLLACIVVHSLINSLPAMGLLKFGGG